MITIQEASKILGVTPKTLRIWEKDGKIKSYKTEGGHRRYNLQDLESFNEENPLNDSEKIAIKQKIKKISDLLIEIKEIL